MRLPRKLLPNRCHPLWPVMLVVVLTALSTPFMTATMARGQTPGEPLSLAQYRAELVAAIEELEGAPDGEVEATLAALQEHFATITQVELPESTVATGNRVVSVHPLLDNIDLSAEEGEAASEENGKALEDREPSLPAARKQQALAQLYGALVQIDGSASDNTAARLALLAEILARPEFNQPRSLWDRFWQWVEDLLARWLPDTSGATGGGWLALLVRALPWIVTVLIVAATIWLLSYWLQRLLRTFVRDAQVAAFAADDDLPASSAEARQQARDAAQSGHYRDAVRRLYLAALLQLSEHHLITYQRSLTNREVLVRVPKDSPLRPHLEPVIATFDQVWYGVREPDQETFNAYEQEIEVLAAVAARAAEPVQREGAK